MIHAGVCPYQNLYFHYPSYRAGKKVNLPKFHASAVCEKEFIFHIRRITTDIFPLSNSREGLVQFWEGFLWNI